MSQAEKISVEQQPLFSLEDIERILYNESSCVSDEDVPELMANAFAGLLQERLKDQPSELESLAEVRERYRQDSLGEEIDDEEFDDDEDFDDEDDDDDDDEDEDDDMF